jgi:hypothetical protein
MFSWRSLPVHEALVPPIIILPLRRPLCRRRANARARANASAQLEELIPDLRLGFWMDGAVAAHPWSTTPLGSIIAWNGFGSVAVSTPTLQIGTLELAEIAQERTLGGDESLPEGVTARVSCWIQQTVETYRLPAEEQELPLRHAAEGSGLRVPGSPRCALHFGNRAGDRSCIDGSTGETRPFVAASAVLREQGGTLLIRSVGHWKVIAQAPEVVCQGESIEGRRSCLLSMGSDQTRRIGRSTVLAERPGHIIHFIRSRPTSDAESPARAGTIRPAVSRHDRNRPATAWIRSET